ncbi:MAG: hypothetical protein ACRERV_00085 [Methylococcales bacterium]
MIVSHYYFWRRNDVGGHRVGVPSLSLRDQSDRLFYLEYYDDESIWIVAKHFTEDVSLFGYAFDDAPGIAG